MPNNLNNAARAMAHPLLQDSDGTQGIELQPLNNTDANIQANTTPAANEPHNNRNNLNIFERFWETCKEYKIIVAESLTLLLTYILFATLAFDGSLGIAKNLANLLAVYGFAQAATFFVLLPFYLWAKPRFSEETNRPAYAWLGKLLSVFVLLPGSAAWQNKLKNHSDSEIAISTMDATSNAGSFLSGELAIAFMALALVATAAVMIYSLVNNYINSHKNIEKPAVELAEVQHKDEQNKSENKNSLIVNSYGNRNVVNDLYNDPHKTTLQLKG